MATVNDRTWQHVSQCEMTKIMRSCRWCLELFADTEGRMGRPKRYCSDACKQRAKEDRRHAVNEQADEAKINALIAQDPPSAVRPFSWWVAQACNVGGRCPKCDGLTEGRYVSATQETLNECAVVEHCVICGWEHPVLTGQGGVPYTIQPTIPRSVPTRITPAAPPERRGGWRGGPKALREKGVKLPGQAFVKDPGSPAHDRKVSGIDGRGTE